MNVTAFLESPEKKSPLLLQFVLSAQLTSSRATPCSPLMKQGESEPPLFLNVRIHGRVQGQRNPGPPKMH